MMTMFNRCRDRTDRAPRRLACRGTSASRNLESLASQVGNTLFAHSGRLVSTLSGHSRSRRETM